MVATQLMITIKSYWCHGTKNLQFPRPPHPLLMMPLCPVFSNASTIIWVIFSGSWTGWHLRNIRELRNVKSKTLKPKFNSEVCQFISVTKKNKNSQTMRGWLWRLLKPKYYCMCKQRHELNYESWGSWIV